MRQMNLLELVNDEIEAANILFDIKHYHMVCFYAQQIVEKALREFLMCNYIPPLKTHNLIKLNSLCSKIDYEFQIFFHPIAILNQFYTSPRYPDEFSEISAKDTYSKELAEESLCYAKKIAEFCASAMQKNCV